MKQAFKTLWQRLQRLFPALAFFGGFFWDALTLGRSVGVIDLGILAAYLIGAGGILWWLARQNQMPSAKVTEPPTMSHEANGTLNWRAIQHWFAEEGPYVALQFFFGGLFSALFIFYFKSSSHLSAYLVVIFLAILLVANEFLEEHYERFTLTWVLFTICSMLLLNFLIPHLLGSLHPFWFYSSTLLGAGGTLLLRHYAPGQPGRSLPIGLVALVWMMGYWFDMIPPVPLVKKNLAVGQHFDHQQGAYRIHIEKAPWFAFWKQQSSVVHVTSSAKLYCLSSVFAPKGMETKLFHQWSYDDPQKGWRQVSRVGFSMNGGREHGYRGYSFKQSPWPGLWKVEVQSADGRTVARHEFKVEKVENIDIDSLPIWEM